MHSRPLVDGVSFVVNQRPVTIVPRTDETLLETLREWLGHTDVKRGCDEGVCGACTVVLDGNAAPSGLVLTATVAGSQVLTAAEVLAGRELERIKA